MRFGILYILLIIAILTALNGQTSDSNSFRTVYFTEDFESWPPEGWTLSPSTGFGAWGLSNGSTPYHSPDTVTEGSSAAFFNVIDYDYGSMGHMTTPAIDLTSATKPYFAFDFWNFGGNDDVYVAVSTDGGTTFTNLDTLTSSWSTSWTTQAIDLSSYAGQSSVHVKITAVSDFGISCPHIDNIAIIENVFSVTFTVIDSSFNNRDIKWKGTPTMWEVLPMYDDGTNGDSIAFDYIWTCIVDVEYGNHMWGAIENDSTEYGVWLIQGDNPAFSVSIYGEITGTTSYTIPDPGPVLYVSTTGSDNGTGSMADPFATIQKAIDTGNSGDTVLVMPGTYLENIRFFNLPFEYAKDMVVGSLYLTTKDTSYISSTIIDGNYSGTVIKFMYSGQINTELVGMTIQNGLGDGGDDNPMIGKQKVYRLVKTLLIDRYCKQHGVSHDELNQGQIRTAMRLKTFHSLRHTFCSEIHVLAGGDIAKTKEFMAHSSNSTTERYTHLDTVESTEEFSKLMMAKHEA